jgi:ketosteroid isomerase-like protein
MTNFNSTTAATTDPISAGKNDESDREQILLHINGLFQAFIRKDLDAIRRGHTSDWKGFQVKSRSLVRGIDQYMEAAKQALSTFNGTRYELLDVDIQVHGDVAVVFYLARYWFNSAHEEQSIRLRSVDIYRRGPDGWNQSGSNICTVPDES